MSLPPQPGQANVWAPWTGHQVLGRVAREARWR
jgi:hypothetical protein